MGEADHVSDFLHCIPNPYLPRFNGPPEAAKLLVPGHPIKALYLSISVLDGSHFPCLTIDTIASTAEQSSH